MNTSKGILNIIVAILAMSVFQTAWAAEDTESSGETKLKIEDVKDGKDVGNIDEEITNARMRAESGSKSKYSLSFGVGYSGGHLKKPFGKDRPDIIGNPEEETSADFGGSFSTRYRMTENDSLTLGAGFGILTPLQGDVVQGQEQFDVSNPDIGYSRVYKVGQFQTISDVSVVFGTAQAWKDMRDTGTDLESMIILGHNMLTTVGQSALTVGAAVNYYHYLYNNSRSDSFTAYKLALYPYAEYSLNDRYSLRTVFGYFNFVHLRGDGDKSPLVGLHKLNSYQSVGVGMAFTRDFYLYPNIQFVPDDIDMEKTNVALSATINAF